MLPCGGESFEYIFEERNCHKCTAYHKKDYIGLLFLNSLNLLEVNEKLTEYSSGVWICTLDSNKIMKIVHLTKWRQQAFLTFQVQLTVFGLQCIRTKSSWQQAAHTGYSWKNRFSGVPEGGNIG